MTDRLRRCCFLGCSFVKREEGIFVNQIYNNKSLLKKGDQIVKIQEYLVDDLEQIERALKHFWVDDMVRIEIYRNSYRYIINSPLFEYPKENSDEFQVKYDSFEYKNLKIRLILTYKCERNKELLLLLQGIDCRKVDLPFSASNIYKNVIYRLSAKGISTARVELFGNGDSEGEPCSQYGFNEIVDLYQVAIQHLHNNGWKINLFGYSIGGVIAPILANRNKNIIQSLIVFDTLAGNMREYLIRNKIRQSLLRGEDKKGIKKNIEKYSAFTYKLFNEKKSIGEILRDDSTYSIYTKNNLFIGHCSLYFQELGEIDCREEWDKVSQPILFLIGKRDYVIDYNEYMELCIKLCKHNSLKRKMLIYEVDHSLCDKNGLFCGRVIENMEKFLEDIRCLKMEMDNYSL